MHDNKRGNLLFTFTASRRPYLDRGTSKQDGSYQAAKATGLLFICKGCDFYRGTAPLLAYHGSRSPSRPLRPHI